MDFLLALLLICMLLSICISIGKAVEVVTYNLVTPNEKRTDLYLYIEENNSRHRVRRQPNPRRVRRKKK